MNINVIDMNLDSNNGEVWVGGRQLYIVWELSYFRIGQYIVWES